MIFLMIATMLSLMVRILILYSKDVREFMLRFIYGIKESPGSLLAKTGHGDWLFLTDLMSNMNAPANAVFVKELSKINVYD